MLLVCRQELKMARCPKPPKVKFKMKIKMHTHTHPHLSIHTAFKPKSRLIDAEIIALFLIKQVFDKKIGMIVLLNHANVKKKNSFLSI